jgi:flagellar hook-associated protein 1 FlgK
MNELGEKGTITTAIDNFFSALNTFASNTSSQEYRTNVQQQALGMTQTFNNIYEEVQSLWHNQNDSIAIAAQKINSIAQKIANLNDAIAKFEQTGGTANDLNDERNLLIDELSGYVNITYDYNTANSSMIDIKIGNLTLVEGKTVNEIVVDTAKDLIDDIVNGDNDAQAAASARLTELGFTCTETGGVYDVSFNGIALVTGGVQVPNIDDVVSSDLTLWVAFNRNNLTLDAAPLELGSEVTSGKLCSYMEMVSNQSAVNAGIPFYMEQINNFVREIAKNLNDIAASGYTYPYVMQDGTPVASQSGINLFYVPDAGSGPDYKLLNAGNFTISAEVLESVWNIAGSSTPVDLTAGATESGNNVIALRLFQDLVKNSYYDKLNSIVGNLSIDANTTDSILSTKESLLLSTDTQRLSLSSVSLDEETTNLIIFQQSYQACARVITTLDEMLNTMINNMGITGR